MAKFDAFLIDLSKRLQRLHESALPHAVSLHLHILGEYERQMEMETFSKHHLNVPLRSLRSLRPR